MGMKPTPKVLRAPANESAPISLFMASAARAIAEGVAGDHQQKQFMHWLVFHACGKSYPSYHDTDRDTAFALGRQFVADQINGLLTVDLELLRRNENG